MSRTLFWYIFKDLLRIFMMTSGALAGIMSFGGLLRPLTQNGLDGSQVALLLEYFMPAMSTYSLPVAALFATTMVYGRMSADNEVTACRASGISFLSLTYPAMLLGIVVAGSSLFLLCFTVPAATMKVEQVIYSNLAKLIANEITRTHQTQVNDTSTVFAQDAYLPPPDPKHPGEQSVVLRGPLIVSYVSPDPDHKWYRVAKDFWSSSEATAYIDERSSDGSATLRLTLTDGVVFPREVAGVKANQGGVSTAQFGPVEIPSRVGQKTKFLDIFQLKGLERDPSQGQEVQQVLGQFIRDDQADLVRRQLIDDLNGPAHRCELHARDDTYVLTAPAGVTEPKEVPNGFTVTAPPGGPPVEFRQESGGQVRLTYDGPVCHVAVTADSATDQATVAVEMKDALVDAGDTPSPAPLSRKVTVALPPAASAMKGRTATQYLNAKVGSAVAVRKLRFAWFDLIDHIQSEIHGRAAFVVSCLLLVLVGSSLGMMFRSGNFLTAFAVSVIPAMLSTVLIVTGQHTVESTPELITAHNSPVAVGVSLIWSGNVVIGIAAIVLLVRLQRR